jgi:hydroxymethylpyrimidine pyrophosphatase-like HAD family hydrolase
MSRYYRAVAIDYDGTLTESDAPDADVLTAIRRTRGSGRAVVLVTGRILASLRRSFPEAERTFDAIVAENGGVIWLPGTGARAVAARVPAELADALEARGLPVQRGDVLLATQARHDQAVLQEVARLGLEVRLVRNREELMVLPPGVTKGTGLLEALAELGISGHSTIAVGDAENDHSLVESCELGVAVANAVPSLQAHADVVLGRPQGRGVIDLLGGPLLRGDIRVQPKRWQVHLGQASDGRPVSIPGSQVSLLIAGGSGRGKSHLAGLLAERLVATGYSVCVLDPEGDHMGLESLRGFVVVGGGEPPPSAEHLGRLLRLGSVVVDLSLRSREQKIEDCRRLLEDLEAHRERHGTPHWVIFDEAQLVPDFARRLGLTPGPSAAGVCAVSWRPHEMADDMLAAMDYVLLLPGRERATDDALRRAGFPVPPRGSGQAPRSPAGPLQAVLADRRGATPFVADQRASTHVRHWHKYQSAELPYHQRFFFRSGDRLTGAVAASMADFHHEIGRAEPDVLRHHARHRDFSRWTDDVIRAHDLAARLRQAEEGLTRDGRHGIEEGRRLLLQVIETHYAGD